MRDGKTEIPSNRWFIAQITRAVEAGSDLSQVLIMWSCFLIFYLRAGAQVPGPPFCFTRCIRSGIRSGTTRNQTIPYGMQMLQAES